MIEARTLVRPSHRADHLLQASRRWRWRRSYLRSGRAWDCGRLLHNMTLCCKICRLRKNPSHPVRSLSRIFYPPLLPTFPRLLHLFIPSATLTILARFVHFVQIISSFIVRLTACRSPCRKIRLGYRHFAVLQQFPVETRPRLWKTNSNTTRGNARQPKDDASNDARKTIARLSAFRTRPPSSRRCLSRSST